jgi:hypothetical protein
MLDFANEKTLDTQDAEARLGVGLYACLVKRTWEKYTAGKTVGLTRSLISNALSHGTRDEAGPWIEVVDQRFHDENATAAEQTSAKSANKRA